ncbi:uncharacterized protein J4E78_007475 [Alternaria triticimaculans]|uniref:uncharacterized protein n=1 Tax=Alternaria triticimaculans TaxID=297637 RepID=UPI0020C36A30|nr:uncharacterized protein J4E78_007475 [Alternaria triticimaculans]KAI4654429.1 hypothetical protein J4E78_007475 [Alternaria triticimaculans]
MSEQLRVKCNEALKQERKTELQLAAAKTKVKKLRRRCKKLQETSDDDKTETADAFLAFAKNDCLEFCTQVHKTFPREIRDTIYGYITGFKDVSIECDEHGNLEHFDFFLAWGQELCLDPAYDGADHWWKPEYVGPAMVRELGENFYRTSSFAFQGDLAAVGPFRATDVWDFGFSPVEFVSKVDVNIRCDDYKFELIDRPNINVRGNHNTLQASSKVRKNKNVGTKNTQKHLLVKLESLFGFKHGTALTIRLSSRQGTKHTPLEQQEWMSHNVVPVILPVLQRLKDAGSRVRIVLTASRARSHATFTSEWGQTSLESITKDFWGYVDVEQKRITQTELDAEPFEDSDDGGVFESNAADAWAMNAPDAWGGISWANAPS